MFDNHLHTSNSHDAHCSTDEMCRAAAQKGLAGISITDHCDCGFYESGDVYRRMSASVKEAHAAKEKYAGTLEVGVGVEMGEAIWRKDAAEEILCLADYDVVLGSVHCVRFENWTQPFSGIDFSDANQEWILAYLKQYFTDVKEMIRTTDFDVLAHLTVPLRYINGKYKKNIMLSVLEKDIEDILRMIVDRDIALELNTSGADADNPIFMPGKEILLQYKALGGKLVTVGSDAHRSENIAKGFEQAAILLKQCGFSHNVHYRNRKPVLQII